MSRSKFTQPVRDCLTSSLRTGMPVRYACALAGIDSAQFYRWHKRGETAREGSTWRQFYLDIERAMAETIVPRIERIERAGKDGDWRADAWMLERRFPGEFAKNRPGLRGAGPVLIQLSLSDGRPALRSLPSSSVEVLEQDSGSPAA